MTQRLSDRERRTVAFGVAAVLVLGGVMGGPPWWDHLQAQRADIARMEAAIELAQGDSPKIRALSAIVPVFAVPEAETQQKFLFRERLAAQLKKAGLKTEPLEADTRRGGKVGAYGRLTLTYRGKARWPQILDLLAGLKDNPYLAGVEQMQIQADAKQQPSQRKDLEFTLVVSTLVK